FRPIITPPAPALQPLHLRKFRLPKPQDMLRYVKFIRYFADRSKGIGGLLRADPGFRIAIEFTAVVTHLMIHRPLSPRGADGDVVIRPRPGLAPSRSRAP